jgi:hypothetical protein
MTGCLLVQGHPDLKKFRKGLPIYLPEMDRMFEGVAVDGSTSFVATAEQPLEPAIDQLTEEPIECDSSDEADGDDQADELTPLSVGTKRASSTSTTASSPSKKSKSPAVRAMDSRMSEYNEIARNKLSVLQNIWNARQAALEGERKALEEERRAMHEQRIAMQEQHNQLDWKVRQVNELAKECGVTPSATPTLFMGVLEIIKEPSVMDLFIVTEPEGRMLIIKKYAGVNN